MTLEDFFTNSPAVALAFSGGVDSAYLLYAARKYGARVHAYYVKTEFQPAFELADAKRIAANVPLTIISRSILAVPHVEDNDAQRCYYCKTALFGAIADQAAQDGYTVLIDGTNASDDAQDRPGMRALAALAVRSPLRECGITKDEIRLRSQQAGLFTWDKPAYACLATRIPTGRRIEATLLQRVEHAEDALHELGFTDCRVRVLEEAARIQLPAAQMQQAFQKREQLQAALKPWFAAVLLDLQAR